MLFKKELAEAIADGKKTQTRRPVKPREVFAGGAVYTESGRVKHGINRVRSVVCKRGKPTMLWLPDQGRVLSYEEAAAYGADLSLVMPTARPLRIRIERIRCEDARLISLDDAKAEGFEARRDFWQVWAEFYDRGALDVLDDPVGLMARDARLWQCWAYDFVLLRD